jgi:hypothetical protein
MIDVFGTEAVDLFAAGKLDAYMAFPPEVQLNRWPCSRETENSSSPPPRIRRTISKSPRSMTSTRSNPPCQLAFLQNVRRSVIEN